MKRAFWNYSEPVLFRVVEIKLHSVEKPILHWQNAFAGDVIQAIEVTHGKHTFLIDNQDGSGLHKIEGRGGPQYSSRHVAGYDFIREVHDESEWIEYDKFKVILIDQATDRWARSNHPEEFEKLVALINARPKF
jgi:hypothetical protein